MSKKDEIAPVIKYRPIKEYICEFCFVNLLIIPDDHISSMLYELSLSSVHRRHRIYIDKKNIRISTPSLKRMVYYESDKALKEIKSKDTSKFEHFLRNTLSIEKDET